MGNNLREKAGHGGRAPSRRVQVNAAPRPPASNASPRISKRNAESLQRRLPLRCPKPRPAPRAARAGLYLELLRSPRAEAGRLSSSTARSRGAAGSVGPAPPAHRTNSPGLAAQHRPRPPLRTNSSVSRAPLRMRGQRRPGHPRPGRTGPGGEEGCAPPTGRAVSGRHVGKRASGIHLPSPRS